MTLLEHLSGHCSSDETTYVDWKCSPDNHNLCKKILDKWNLLKENVLVKDDGSTNVNMQSFKKKEMKLNDSRLFQNL